MFEVTVYKTKKSFDINRPTDVFYEKDEQVADELHTEHEDKNAYLVTTTDENGKLIR
ncbi:hypothetical protein [Vibrio sp. Hal054]|uniref:hypothetical protein n=1 Tax=Vibrio sp. Hal054 TaxID=3035158 RepID=UPI00301E19CF